MGFKKGEKFHEKSISEHLGNDFINKFVSFCLKYIGDLDIPIKRGTFIEFRSGMINVSPIGRNCSQKERDEFEEYDNKTGIRAAMVEEVTKLFGDKLAFSVGG
jgi:phosphomannomutase